MIDHVTIRVSDPAGAERFFDTVLPVTGAQRTGSPGEFGEGCAEFGEWGDFSIAADGPPTTGLHVGFAAGSREQVDAFWQAGVDAGYRSDGEPGERPQYRADYYGAFLLDPDGNSVESVHHAGTGEAGVIDHLWIRVADLAANVAFYEAIAEYSGMPTLWEHPGRVHFGRMGGHFALVDDEPHTQNLHLAFGTKSDDVVDAFHSAAIEAGYRDNGAPGERPQYHPGYYGAFVLDPDGNNVEVVNHNR